MQFNFSAVPTKDLKVIRAFFMWSSFTRKEEIPGATSGSFAGKVINDAIKGLFGRGLKNFVTKFVVDAGTFSEIVFCLLFHPRIRKKYGLTRTRKTPSR
jgi:hypothetical protein